MGDHDGETTGYERGFAGSKKVEMTLLGAGPQGGGGGATGRRGGTTGRRGAGRGEEKTVETTFV